LPARIQQQTIGIILINNNNKNKNNNYWKSNLDDSLETPLTMWDDWRQAIQERRDHQQQHEDKMAVEQDAKFQATIDRLLEEDGTYI
jgi:hypothetical protein